jgi:small subunit ribosomal protein S16
VAVKIKLKRLGRTRVPTYRIVVADARTKRDGRAIEEIGKYHPKEEPSLIEVNSERAQHWLSVGAQPTEPVLTILKITGDWQKFKGEPGAEGTLRTREVAADKKERFAAALKDAAKDEVAAPKGGSRARKPDTAKADAPKADGAKASTASTAKPDSGRAKSKAGAETAAAGSADESAAVAATATAGEPQAGGPQAGGPQAGEAQAGEAQAGEAQAGEAQAGETQGSEPGSGA